AGRRHHNKGRSRSSRPAPYVLGSSVMDSQVLVNRLRRRPPAGILGRAGKDSRTKEARDSPPDFAGSGQADWSRKSACDGSARGAIEPLVEDNPAAQPM